MSSQYGAGGYPSQSRVRSSPRGVPLAPQVAQILALAPEAAPELASASAPSTARAAKPGSAGSHDCSSSAISSARQAKPGSAGSQDAFGGMKPRRPPKPEGVTDASIHRANIGSSPTPVRKTAACAPSASGAPKGRPVRRTGMVTSTTTTIARKPASGGEGGSGASRVSNSRERRTTTRSPSPAAGKGSERRKPVEQATAKPTSAVLTEAAVLLESEGGESLSDISQLLYRHKGLQSLSVPGTVDFSELIGLRVLSLSHNALSDIRPVADLPLLTDLNVNHNQIKDLSPAYQCEHLEVFLAASNRVSSIEGMQLQSLRHLSLFTNELSDISAVVAVLENLPKLRRLDIGGNPCAEDTSQSYGIVRALPHLAELDGEAVGEVDRALAEEFFTCARDLGFNERPCSSAGRPKTAPAPAIVATRRRRQERPSRSPSVRRSRSPSPFTPASSTRHSPDLPMEPSMPFVEGDIGAAIRERTSQIEAVRLQVQTVQVDCENLRQQIHALRAREPTMGLTGLKERRQQLEEENRQMHERVSENQRLREVLAEKEAQLSAQRQAAGLPEERPRTARPQSSCGPASAERAAEAILELSERLQNEAAGRTSSSSSQSRFLSQEETAADLRFRNHLLRREIEHTKELTSQLSSDTCSALLGKDIMTLASTAESEAPEPSPRRPKTAAARVGQSMSTTETERTKKELDDLLHRNANNLEKLNGQLRKTEFAIGQQRPMTTGHLPQKRDEVKLKNSDMLI